MGPGQPGNCQPGVRFRCIHTGWGFVSVVGSVPDMRQALALIPQQPIKPDKAAHTHIPTLEVEAEGLEVQSYLQLLGEF